MLTIITGTPGAGKTQHMLRMGLELQKTTGRPIYYANIRGLVPLANWYELVHEVRQPLAWHEQAPGGAIVLVDEVQVFWPPRALGSDIPESVERLQTHRHDGYDLICTTQDPTLIDTAVRKVTGRHLHIRRAFNSKRYLVREWDHVQPNPNNFHSKEEALVERKGYDLDVFKMYESTQLDTHKKKIPGRLWLMLAAFPLIPFLLYVAVQALWSGDVVEEQLAMGLNSSQGRGTVGLLQGRVVGVQDYAVEMTPQIASMPWTAPFYADLADPKQFPKLYCVNKGRGDSAGTCLCYTQQGTRWTQEIDPEFCLHNAKFGFFDPFLEPRRVHPKIYFDQRRSNVETKPEKRGITIIGQSGGMRPRARGDGTSPARAFKSLLDDRDRPWAKKNN